MDATTARALNVAASFLPADRDDDGTLPCIEIGGAQVYADIDENGGVPVLVTIGDDVVYSA